MKEHICDIAENDNGDQVRSYIMETMKLIQQVRNRVTNLQNNKIILEECDNKLYDINKLLITVNGLMGEIIGYTVADDVWQHKKISFIK